MSTTKLFGSPIVAIALCAATAFSQSMNVSAVDGASPTEVFLSPQGNYIFASVDFPGAATSVALGVNGKGVVVGWYNFKTTQSAIGGRGFVYSNGVYTALDVPNATTTGPTAINNAGQIAGTYISPDGHEHGFRYSGGTFTTIDYPASVGTNGIGLNNFGEIVGGYGDGAGKVQGFRESAGKFTSIDYPGAIWTNSTGINDAGAITGVYEDTSGKFHGYIYSAGAFTSLDAPGGATDTSAEGINDLGEVSGHFTDPKGTVHGFIYRAGQYTTINVPGAAKTEVGHNAEGRLAGWYADAQGNCTAFWLHGRRESDESWPLARARVRDGAMDLAEIQHAIEELPKEQQAALTAWLAERDQGEWDAEIERDFWARPVSERTSTPWSLAAHASAHRHIDGIAVEAHRWA